MAEYNDYHGYVCIPLCIFGLTLNMLNIIVWSRQRRQTSLVIILTLLSMVDVLVIFSYFLFVITFFLVQTPEKHHHHSWTGMWIALISFHFYILTTTWSNWTVITLAIFRYMKVTNKLLAAKYCTKTRAKVALGLVLVVSSILLIPNIFFYKVSNINSLVNHQDFWIVKTDFSNSAEGYQRFLLWFVGIVMGLGPCIILVYLCSGMIVAVSRMKNEHPMDFNPDKEKKAKMLVVIVLLFLAAMLPNGIYAFFIAIDRSTKPQFFFFMKNLAVSDIFYFLTILNSSASFFVYLYFSESFHRDLRVLFRCDQVVSKWNALRTRYTEVESNVEIDPSSVHINTGHNIQVAVHRDPFFEE